MTKGEMNGYRKALEAKVIELDCSTRRRDAIVIEHTSEEMENMLQFSERDLAVRTLEFESSRLREVRTALQRIQSGTYGICLECEEEISPRRLAALPWAALCIHCQEATDCDCAAKSARPVFAMAA